MWRAFRDQRPILLDFSAAKAARVVIRVSEGMKDILLHWPAVVSASPVHVDSFVPHLRHLLPPQTALVGLVPAALQNNWVTNGVGNVLQVFRTAFPNIDVEAQVGHARSAVCSCIIRYEVVLSSGLWLRIDDKRLSICGLIYRCQRSVMLRFMLLSTLFL